MRRQAKLVFTADLHRQLIDHLFPGDHREHGAVIAAGLANSTQGTRLLVREMWAAREPQDYREGSQGYMGLQASFIHRCITQCRDRRMVYLAVHNHGGSGQVAFSKVDIASHERGYGALLDIANGMPVGALVVADGAMEIDLWCPNSERSALLQACVLGPRIQRLYPNADVRSVIEGVGVSTDAAYARQALFLGPEGQALFERAKVAIIGLGGIGSLVSEYLARLGVGHLVLIDPDSLEASNISRVAGSHVGDLGGDTQPGTLKVNIAARVAREAQPSIRVEPLALDFARDRVARQVLDCDYIFLAADSMRARLVFNAIVHQYYIPGVQLGTKVRINVDSGEVEAAFSVVRTVRPGQGCLVCNQLIDPVRLSEEWKTQAEREDQQYGTGLPNPSVITMNAVAASHAVNDFLFFYTGLRQKEPSLYRRFDHIEQVTIHEHPRQDSNCPMCSNDIGSALGCGDAKPLPTAE